MIALKLPRAPWRDRTGAVSPLRAAVFALVLCPALVQAYALTMGPPLAEPIVETIRQLGDWAIYLLMASLAITPLRQALAWPRLIAVRRMVGVSAFAYVLGHFIAFVANKGFDAGQVASEIVLRTNYAIGAVGFVLLAILAATSTDAMVKRLGGKRWQGLHRLVYLATAAALAHYFLQVKADVSQPMLLSGLAAWLLAYRIVLWTRGSAAASSPVALAGITAVATLTTALAECAYLAGKFGAPFAGLVAMQFDLAPPGPRPAVWVLVAGSALVAAAIVRRSSLPSGQTRVRSRAEGPARAIRV